MANLLLWRAIVVITVVLQGEGSSHPLTGDAGNESQAGTEKLMFIGHYGLSYAAKALDPAMPS